jgi:hypothetical protein
VLPAAVVSLMISSFKLLAHASSLVSWGFWLFVPYSSVIPCHGGLQSPFTTPLHISSALAWGVHSQGSRGKREVEERKKIFWDKLTTMSREKWWVASYVSYT